MGKTKKSSDQKLGLKDIVSFAKAGWTPGDVNAILDRMDEIGDINDPEDNEADDDTTEEENTSTDFDSEGEDESDEDEEDDDMDNSDQESTSSQKKDTNKSIVLEAENTRLKKELAKMQAKNRSKDLSGGENTKPIDKALIDTFQSLFD